MRSRLLFDVIVSMCVLIVTLLTTMVSRQPSELAAQAPKNILSNQDCLSDSQIAAAVQTLSTGTYDVQQQAVVFLRAGGERSSACRKRVITSLTLAMDQPNLNLTGGTPQFFLWHYGTRLLGELKAVEAVDLLIANLDRHDGSGFPFNHYPAVGGVIDIGEVALPKLQIALKDNPDSFTRRLTVFCIALIGGQTAHEILAKALETESDPCVVSCIRASISSFNNKRRPHHIADESRTTWYTTFLCNGE
jgi:hypothetical protein